MSYTKCFSISIILLVLTLNSCVFKRKPVQDEKPIARVLDKYLFPKDIKGIVENTMSKEDSTILVRNYINKWVKTQLLLNRAELNLTENQKDVELQIENYRSSLLIYKYKQKLIAQKLDTLVPDTILRSYYEDNKGNFISTQDLVKAVFVKLYKSAPNISKIKQILTSENPEDQEILESYCFQYAVKYDDFDDTWVVFDQLKQHIGYNFPPNEVFLKYRREAEYQDSLYHYLLEVKEYILKGEPEPYQLVKDDIRNIILNKRKLEFDRNLEHEIFNDAEDRGLFDIY